MMDPEISGHVTPRFLHRRRPGAFPRTRPEGQQRLVQIHSIRSLKRSEARIRQPKVPRSGSVTIRSNSRQTGEKAVGTGRRCDFFGDSLNSNQFCSPFLSIFLYYSFHHPQCPSFRLLRLQVSPTSLQFRSPTSASSGMSEMASSTDRLSREELNNDLVLFGESLAGLRNEEAYQRCKKRVVQIRSFVGQHWQSREQGPFVTEYLTKASFMSTHSKVPPANKPSTA